jgi:N-acetylglucosaminyldiphosphoundecaprenol N-acetyl-beta-D-mannosaminyltransferase
MFYSSQNYNSSIQVRTSVMNVRINAVSWASAISQIVNWSTARESRYVCFCNVHSLVTAKKDGELNLALANADIAFPDGAPVAWVMRRQGFPSQERISGPDLMWIYLRYAEELRHTVFLYGSTEATLALLHKKISCAFPALKIAGMHAPPFGANLELDDRAELEMINRSRANVVFVGLGCPKQEKWMALHRGRVNAVMIGVGAAFDYHSGNLKRAPSLLQKVGLEWLFRLASEPKRLFKRYLICNTIFVVFVAKQSCKEYFSRKLLGR